jgi:hypothetical protein
MVLADGEEERAATARVLKRYAINEPFHFSADSVP